MSSLVPVLPGLQAHASGALWLPESQTAIIADIHLGYSWAQRRRGELGPLADERTRSKLFGFRDEMHPRQFIFLGDVVHAPRPCAPEREYIEDTLAALASTADLITVRGNHDRHFAREFSQVQCQCVETWSEGNITAVHGDRFTFAWPEGHTLVLGHLHPSLAVRDASGAGHKMPIFLVSPSCLVLPAFSPFARGYDVASGLPAEIGSCFRKNEIVAYAASGKRVVRLGALRQTLDTMTNSDLSSAAQFRGRRRRMKA
jgi:uncharacterized protein